MAEEIAVDSYELTPAVGSPPFSCLPDRLCPPLERMMLPACLSAFVGVGVGVFLLTEGLPLIQVSAGFG